MVALFGVRIGVCIGSRGSVVSLALAMSGKLRDVGNERKDKYLGCRAVLASSSCSSVVTSSPRRS
jgi:hypothetical protein